MALALAAPASTVEPVAAEDAARTGWVVTLAPGSHLDDFDSVAIGPRDAVVDATATEAAALAGAPGVVAVERDEPAAAALSPTDPCFAGGGCPVDGDQRALRRIGAETAWDVVPGAPDVLVAMVDAGVDTSHPDLAGRVIAVPNGPGGCAALDPSLPTTDRTARGHGTRVAGIIAAANDAAGIAGVALDGVQVRSYTALGPDLRGTTSAVAAAIHCAIDDGADVINLSLTAGDTTAMRNALDRAAAAGVIVVAAAGNGGDGQHPGLYPAAHPSVIAVTSVTGTPGDEWRAPNANGGSWIDVAAPGTGIVSTAPGGGWSVGDGTSYAVPFVTGAAALVLARAPGLDAAGVKARIEMTAESLPDLTVGRGLVDLSAAVRLLTDGPPACSTVPGWLLDANGQIRAVGGAADVSIGAGWPGWDIARDIVTVPGRPGGYVVDGYGGLHPFGGAPAISSPFYVLGWDVVRGADRRADGSVVVVDAQGGLHVAGGGPTVGGGPWWPGSDIARDVAVDPADPTVAYVLDAYGGVHVAGHGPDAPRVEVARYTLGRDLARRLVVLPGGGRGYVLDRDGRLHAWAVAGEAMPPPIATATFGLGGGRGIVHDPATGRVVVATTSGSVVPARRWPCTAPAAWPGQDLTRGFALAP